MEENKLIVVEQLPIIKERLEGLSKEIDKKVENALSLVCNEDTRKDVKEVRALLKKQFTELEEQRKYVKKMVLDPYNKFEEVYKEYVSDKFKYADAELKEKIENVENELKSEKRHEVIKYFDEYKESLNIDFVFFNQSNINVDLSTSLKKLKEQAKEFLDKVNDDLKLIEAEENKAEILVEYKKSLNVSEAILNVKNRIKAIEEEKARQEELAKQKEIENEAVAKVEEVSTIDIPVEENVDVNLLKMTFTVYGTIEQLKSVKEFLEKEGLRYE